MGEVIPAHCNCWAESTNVVGQEELVEELGTNTDVRNCNLEAPLVVVDMMGNTQTREGHTCDPT